jgi:hypothetical protein
MLSSLFKSDAIKMQELIVAIKEGNLVNVMESLRRYTNMNLRQEIGTTKKTPLDLAYDNSSGKDSDITLALKQYQENGKKQYSQQATRYMGDGSWAFSKPHIILVVDLDDTLIYTTKLISQKQRDVLRRPNTNLRDYEIEPYINKGLIKILERAAKLRAAGHIASIVMLTNNDSSQYISRIDRYLKTRLESTGKFQKYATRLGYRNLPYFFDYIMDNRHPARSSNSSWSSKSKSLKDVEYMSIQLELPHTRAYLSPEEGLRELRDNTYFFDNIGTFQLTKELGDKFIYITTDKFTNTTDYTTIDKLFTKFDRFLSKEAQYSVAARPPPSSFMKYNFDATSPDTLTVKKGDKLMIKERDNEGWAKVKLTANSREGWVPLSYIQVNSVSGGGRSITRKSSVNTKRGKYTLKKYTQRTA